MDVAVLLSGGVDSSVALALLKRQGYRPTAFYLKIWLEDELASLGQCPWEEDLSYVRAVCAQEGVPLEVLSLQRVYWDTIVTYTISEIKKGHTPNPDVLCNSRIKFDAFLKAIGSTFHYSASGHYAQVRQETDGTPALFCSPDVVKDQTYFLAHMNVEQFSQILFPIGHLTKAEVRMLAQAYNLPNKDRKDSQGLCFLGKLKFSDFIKYHLGEKPGLIVEEESGIVLGEHKGFWYYTIGQRQGLRLAGGPWYVVRKDIERNVVFASRDYYNHDKKRDTCTIRSCNWLAAPTAVSTLEVKLRHGVSRHGCRLDMTNAKPRLYLNGSDQGIAPGQFAVFYDGYRCLGSGIIDGW
jgi:tRNA (5-methylaminomethyl-2-thiouridylate)-methyltransferase